MSSPKVKVIPVVSRIKALINLRPFIANPIEVLDIYGKEHGDTFEIFMGGIERALITTNPKIIRHILQKNNRNYKKSHIQNNTLGRFLGNGLLTSEGEYWLKQRRLIQPGFHKTKLEGLTKIMSSVIDNYFNDLDTQIKSKPLVDSYEVMMELAFLTVAKSLFSTSVKEGDLRRLNNNLTLLQEFIIKQIRVPFLAPWFKISGTLKKHDRISKDSKDLVLGYIQERRASGQSQDDLLDMLLAARYEDNNEGMSDEQLLDETLILFVAGHETTANALAWITYLLTKHPETIKKIRKELQDCIENKNPTFSDLPKLKYLRQVIEESMRLYPPAWITDRVAIADDEIDGYKIPKGKLVVPYIYGVHRSEKFWEKPSAFIPERFEAARKKEQTPFAYLPFGGGPRFCIGQSFAMMEMQLIVAAFVQRYDFELEPGQEITTKPLVTLRPKDGVKLKLRTRERNVN